MRHQQFSEEYFGYETITPSYWMYKQVSMYSYNWSTPADFGPSTAGWNVYYSDGKINYAPYPLALHYSTTRIDFRMKVNVLEAATITLGVYSDDAITFYMDGGILYPAVQALWEYTNIQITLPVGVHTLDWIFTESNGPGHLGLNGTLISPTVQFMLPD